MIELLIFFGMGWFAYKVVSDDEFRDKVKEYVNQD
jgi:hypothetical protein